MRQISWAFMVILVMGGLKASVRDAKGADQVSVQDLANLSQADRIDAMKSLLERRIDKVRNIELASETRAFTREYLNGRLGRRLATAGWYEFHTKHCDGSYQVKSSFFVAPDATDADSTSVSHYDEKTGIVRIVSPRANGNEHEGRIGLEHLPALHSNRVAFHLLGGSFVIQPAVDRCEFLLQSLAACSDQWHVDVNVQEQQVTISHPYRIAFVETGTGTRKVYFDAAKGFMPVQIDVDYRDEWVTSLEPRRLTPVWREERIVMDEAKDFGGFWMPMRIEERVRATPSGSQNVCSVHLTNVKQIAFGGVKKEDLEIKFPPDTQVADALKNVFYRTGPDGEPVGPINPIGIPEGPIMLDDQGQLIVVPKQSWMLRVGLWSLGIGMVLFLCLILLRRFRVIGSN